MEVLLKILPLVKFPIPLEVLIYVTLSWEGLMISDVKFIVTRNTMSVNIYSCFNNMMALKK